MPTDGAEIDVAQFARIQQQRDLFALGLILGRRHQTPRAHNGARSPSPLPNFSSTRAPFS